MATQAPADAESVRDSADVRYHSVVDLFVNVDKESKPRRRRNLLALFRRNYLPSKPTPELCYEVYRLVLPDLDKERQVYKLKEQAMADVLAGAFSIPKARPSAEACASERQRRRWRSHPPALGVPAAHSPLQDTTLHSQLINWRRDGTGNFASSVGAARRLRARFTSAILMTGAPGRAPAARRPAHAWPVGERGERRAEQALQELWA